MPSGLQVWDANGVLTYDTNFRVARSLGAVAPGLGQSVYTDDRLTTGIPWAFAVFEGTQLLFGAYDVQPQQTAPSINFSGNQMIITRNASGIIQSPPGCTVYYGVR